MQLMIDIETFGSQADAEILQIGAVSFDFTYQVQEAVEILNNPDRWINIYPAHQPGRTREKSNYDFWHSPAQEGAFAQIISAPKIPLKDALEQLSAFVGSYLGKRANIWANPPGFDLRVLRHAYESENLKCPWHYKQEACLRTLVWTADRVPRNKFRMPDISSQGLIAHNALHDSVEQTLLAQGAYRALLLQAKES